MSKIETIFELTNKIFRIATLAIKVGDLFIAFFVESQWRMSQIADLLADELNFGPMLREAIESPKHQIPRKAGEALF